MKIKRTLDTTNANYDLLELTDKEFNLLVRAYEHYMFYTRHCPPSEDDSMWQKMRKISEERIIML
jgi:hypothetical protein